MEDRSHGYPYFVANGPLGWIFYCSTEVTDVEEESLPNWLLEVYDKFEQEIEEPFHWYNNLGHASNLLLPRTGAKFNVYSYLADYQPLFCKWMDDICSAFITANAQKPALEMKMYAEYQIQQYIHAALEEYLPSLDAAEYQRLHREGKSYVEQMRNALGGAIGALRSHHPDTIPIPDHHMRQLWRHYCDSIEEIVGKVKQGRTSP